MSFSMTDFSKKLNSLARKGDSELISVFEASCDGTFDEDTFDVKFFLDNARELIKEKKSD